MRYPLYPFEHGRDFRVGQPLNGMEIPHEGTGSYCRDWRRDYSGKDLEIQYPEFWHCVAGKGGLAGGFHQGFGPGQFEPWRIGVVGDSEKPRNLIELDGSGIGKAELAKWFDYDLWHPGASAQSSENGILMECTFRLLGDGPYYWNFELRGELSFIAHKNESVECMGIHLMNGKLMVAYWKDAVDGSRTDEKRVEIKESFPVKFGKWYRLNLEMKPTENDYEWATRIQLKQQQEIVYRFRTATGTHPNNIQRITQICIGKERERIYTPNSKLQIARAMCWEIGS